MKGYRTIIVNGLAFVAAVTASYGLEITAENQGALVAGIMTALNIYMRFKTTTPVGKKG